MKSGRLRSVVIVATVSIITIVRGQSASNPSSIEMKKPLVIRFVSGGPTVTATLEDNATARAFFSMLPLVVELEDYARTERVCDLPKRLPTDGAPAGYEAKAGDLTYYAPWGNFAAFYQDFHYASGLVHLGSIDGDGEALLSLGLGEVRIEAVESSQ